MPKLKSLVGKKEEYEQAIQRRGLEEIIPRFEEGLSLYDQWRKKLNEVQNLRAEMNRLSREFNKTRDKSLIEKSKEIKARIKQIDDEVKRIESEMYQIELMLPNWIHPDVPDGEGDDYEKPIKYLGTPKVWKDHVNDFEARYPSADYSIIDYEPFHHYNLVGKLIDQEKAGELAMSRFYYLFDELVALDLAINMYAIEFFKNRGFERLVIPPFMMRRDVEARIAYLEAFKDTIFNVDDGMILIPTSEHGIIAYYEDTIFNPDNLPLRILAWSPCFRKEAGSHGKDTRGIFRVRQFLKTELHTITRREEDLDEVYRYADLIQEFLDSMGLPNRVVIVPTKDMDKRAYIQLDVETWFPAQGKYRETHSIATVDTWISEKLKIRYGAHGGDKELVRNVYATGAASERLVCAIAENFYEPDSKVISIPKVLQKYTFGIKEIKLD